MTDAFTDVQKEQAATLASEIQVLLESNRTHKSLLEQNFVEIGDRLVTIRTGKFWHLFGFKNFSAFMGSLDSRTQNYHCMGVARDLLPFVSREDLVAMGITKATALRLVIKGGKIPTEELIELAKSGTKETLEDEVAKLLGLVEDEEPGTWFSYGGARLSDDEKEEFLRTMNTVIQAAEIGSEQIANWQDVPSKRKKEIIHLLCAEFLSTYVA